MKWKCKIFGLLVAISACGTAWADGLSAAHNLFTNLSHGGKSIGLTESSIQVMPTLVRGIYVINDNRGQFAGYVNEAGTLYGSSAKNLSVVSTTGTPLRSMTSDELADLRAEVMSSINFDMLIKVQYGNGGDRKIILFSAIDCLTCKGLEGRLQKHEHDLNTTFYVVPSSLQGIDGGGGFLAWQTAARIWCADDSGAAWKAYWTSHAVPQPRSCQFSDPHAARKAAQTLQALLVAIGINGINAVPLFVREDGKFVSSTSKSDLQDLGTLFQPNGKPQAIDKPAHWLVISQ